MWLYSIIMFLAAIPTLWISIAIYKGKTNLIHDYHQEKVKDKAAYGKAFGKAMLVISMAMFLSGIVALLGNSEKAGMWAIAVLFVGLAAGIIGIVAVQKKFNNGIF